MTATAGNTHIHGPAGQGRTRHVLLRDDLGRLTMRRLRPWHRMLARCAGGRLDRELAAGTSPEISVGLAARAMQLTSMKYRRELATNVQRILAAAGSPPAAEPTIAGHPLRLPLSRARIRRSAAPLAALAGCLTTPGPVPVQGVAMVSRLLTDGAGPLYCAARGDDLGVMIETMTRALNP
jgi:hypothetical protein